MVLYICICVEEALVQNGHSFPSAGVLSLSPQPAVGFTPVWQGLLVVPFQKCCHYSNCASWAVPALLSSAAGPGFSLEKWGLHGLVRGVFDRRLMRSSLEVDQST